MAKKPYIAPIVECDEYLAEAGFAYSASPESEFIGDVEYEEVTEGDKFTLFDDDGWF